MSNYVEVNNNVQLIGTIFKKPELNHCIYNEEIYQILLKVERTSGIYDYIPVCISERLIDISLLSIDIRIRVTGRYSSYNMKKEDKTSLLLYVFANEIELIQEDAEDINEIIVYGSICKDPIYRKTPLGREIADILIAVNRSYGKSDYIPCICWGRNAKYVSKLGYGVLIHIVGRIQSREYIKDSIKRTAYEVSVNQIYA